MITNVVLILVFASFAVIGATLLIVFKCLDFHSQRMDLMNKQLNLVTDVVLKDKGTSREG